MKFNLKDPNPGAWFDLVEGKPEEGRICLRQLNHDAARALEKQTTKRQVEYKKGQRFEYTDSDPDLYTELLWDYCILDWQGIEDEKGKPIPCTRENKVVLMRGSLEFQRMVAEGLDRLSADFEERKKALRKN